MPEKISSSRVRVLSLVLVIILTTAFSIITDFVSTEFSSTLFSSPTYWLNTASSQLAVIVLILVSRSLAKEKEGALNALYNELRAALHSAYVQINSSNMNGALRDYIHADNRARKLKAYREKLGARHTRYNDKIRRLRLAKERLVLRAENKNKTPHGLRYALICHAMNRAEIRLHFWQGKLERAEEEVDYVRGVRYIKYSYSILFNDAHERVKEENDPYAHEGRAYIRILLTKALCIFAFGVIATSYIAYDLAFSVNALLKAIVKLLQIVLGIYTGTLDGQDFIRNTMCSKLTIRFNYVKQFKEQAKTAPSEADVGEVSNHAAAH